MTYLELGDGSKMISHGKCPHVCTRVGDPLISWKAHKLWIKGVHGIEKYLAKVYLQI